MIKIRTLKAFFDRVDDQNRSPTVEALASRWDADPASVRVFNASSNISAVFTVSGRRLILRCVPVEDRPEDLLHAELAFVRHLADRRVKVPESLCSGVGRLVEHIDSPVGPLHATAWTHLEGRCLEDVAGEGVGVLRAWGRSLAQIHAAAEGYAQPGRPDLSALLEHALARLGPSETAARDSASLLTHRMAHWKRDPGTYGLLHFDLSIDNLIFGEGEPAIVDFDDCAYGWHGSDIAFALRSCFGDRITGIDPEDARLESFLSGYRDIRPVPDHTLERLPHYLAMNHLHQLGNLATSTVDAPGVDDPPWIARLRLKLQAKCACYREELKNYCKTG